MTILHETEVSRLNDEIMKLQERLAEIQLEKNHWHPKQPIDNSIGGKHIGLYRISHNDEVMYVGMGNLNNRRARHILVFENKGKADVSKNGHSSDSAVAKKMYNYDKDINNWFIEYMTLDGEIDRSVADGVMKKMEHIFYQEHRPVFCTEHMVGK